jgi:hypothetical protein
MASAAEFLRRLQSVNKITVLRDMVYDEIKANEDILRDIKEEEYEEGNIRSNGTLSTYASKNYAKQKKFDNPRANGFVDLMDTHDFIDSFKLNKPKQNRYTWGATDSKRNDLVKKYGDIMSLDQESFDKFQIEVIAPLFRKKLKAIINR